MKENNQKKSEKQKVGLKDGFSQQGSGTGETPSQIADASRLNREIKRLQSISRKF